MRKWGLSRFLVVFVGVLAFGLERQAPADYHARRVKLAKALDGGALVLFTPTEASGGNAINGFIPDKNFYYLTGWSEPGAGLVIVGGSKYQEALFLPERNPRQERWTGAKAEIRSGTAGFARVESLDHMREFLSASLPEKAQVIYTDIPGLNETSSSQDGIAWLQRANAFADSALFKNANGLIGDLRRFKDAGEMRLLTKASEATVAAHLAALHYIDSGVSERSIASLMTFELGKRGCERMSYAPIVGSGQNSTVLHYSENSGTLKAGDLVVMDVGGECSLYASDVTRTAPVNGKFTARQREIYNIVLGAQNAAIAAIQPGKSTFMRTAEHSIYKVAFNYINTHGKDLHGKPLGQYFIHGVTHYIGLDVHDAGTPRRHCSPAWCSALSQASTFPKKELG